jgi:flavin reductase (DIM6/NTAB) family NADH-FMN oxidoreductase RutF
LKVPSAKTRSDIENKINLGATVAAYSPCPVILVGANVKGKPNFLPIGWFTGAGFKPPKLAVVSGKVHYTNQGIKENKTFSVCIPSEDMIEATDYCGCVSGSKMDKSTIFVVFYGKLKTAPMIAECPINLECRLDKVIDIGQYEIFIGGILSTYTEEKYLINGTVDLKKTRPFLLSPCPLDLEYYTMGEPIGKAWSVGKNFKNKRKRATK